MQFELTHANAKLGPLLIFDRAFRERWAQKSKDFILKRGHHSEAASGACAFLERGRAKTFSGSVEVVVGEAAPKHSVYAQHKTTGLRLQVPSGRVQLGGIGTTPLCEVEIPPGEYEADLFAYLDHPTRLARTLLPFEPRETRWSLVIAIAFALSLVATITGLAASWPLLQSRLWQPLVYDLGGMAASWAMTAGLYVLSGERRRMRVRRRLFKRALERLPKIPDFTVVLRLTVNPRELGGGVSLE